MPGRQTRTCSAVGCSLQSTFRGRRPKSRVLRGGSFNNNAQNARSATRNNNQPENRNNNNGFRAASTLRQTSESVVPESAGQNLTFVLQSVPECKVQAVVLCRAGLIQFGQTKNRPGRSGRSQDSNALPGHFSWLAAAHFL